MASAVDEILAKHTGSDAELISQLSKVRYAPRENRTDPFVQDDPVTFPQPGTIDDLTMAYDQGRISQAVYRAVYRAVYDRG